MNQGSPLLHSLFATIAENVEVPVEVVYPRDLDHYVNTHSLTLIDQGQMEAGTLWTSKENFSDEESGSEN